MKFRHRAGAKARLHFDGRGLRIEPKQGAIARLEWGSVLEVFAFKEDVFACDIICIGFRTDDVGGYFKIDEDCEGYGSLLDFLPRMFPGIRTDWFPDVAFPAFEPCVTTLWGTAEMEKIWKR